MLSNNNMLTVGGGSRQRQRGTVRVNEPSKGFFITGSSIAAMNGVYVRRNPPRTRKEGSPIKSLYYEHEEGTWHMILQELLKPEIESDDDDEFDDYYSRFRRRERRKKTHEWVFTDEFDAERFVHDGDTIIPGAGVRWKHVHKVQPAAEEPTLLSSMFGASATSTQVAEIKEDDEEELPWQVIAILDEDMVEQLLWGSMNHKEKIKKAKAGKNASAPARASLEACFAPGRWLFQVSSADGVVLHIAPDDTAQAVGRREVGEYLRGVKLGSGGEWLCLHTCEDLAMDTPRVGRARNDHYYNSEYARRQLWVRLCEPPGGATTAYFLREVLSDETAVLDLKDVGEVAESAEVMGVEAWAEKSGKAGAAAERKRESEKEGSAAFTGDLFDKPFVPRMEDVDAEDDEAAEEARVVVRDIKAGREDPVLAALHAAAVAAQERVTEGSKIPVGAVVEVTGLKSRVGMQYNGVTGVVVTSSQNGRQGVRLDAPLSGKVLACRPENLLYSQNDEEDEEEESSKLSRAARLLGIDLVQLALASPEGIEPPSAPSSGWGFAGLSPAQRLGCALRSAIRDIGPTSGQAFHSQLRDAAEVLFTELGARELQSFLQRRESEAAAAAAVAAAEATPSTVVDDASSSAGTAQREELPRSAELMLRFGALGSRVAASIVSSFSPLNADEREAGLVALRAMVQEEASRAAHTETSVFVSPGEDSGGGDEVVLRLALVQALLEGRHEADALAEARRVVQLDESKLSGCDWHRPAMLLLLGQCLLRQGMRAEGLGALERAEKVKSSPPPPRSGDVEAAPGLLDWLRPLWEWGCDGVAQMLTAHRAAEKCRVAAVDAYSRGAFEDGALLFGRALDLLRAGCCDDKRGRATVLADRAGCLRRARKLDEAVADLEAALRLFPRYARALFRRAACLLEAGKAPMAVEAFKDLYRVDRDWPNLSEWLIRAYSLQKRQAKGHKAAETAQYEEPEGAEKDSMGIGSSSSDADLIAKEVDHYTVLGVNTDATEKQLKTAYRMRSLQFHPDRKQGNTAAFQRIAEAFEVLSDADKRRAYDEGGDIKVKRGKRDDDDNEDDSEDEEEHKTTMREEVEREFYPEKYHYWPFGDPFIYKRKHMAQKRAKEGKPKEDEGWS